MILTLASKLDCEVIAEGVEKPTQIETLRTMGCSLAQGYLLSSPLDSKAALL
jgi:EAL domain-containing protein (putative c-di-GMP-specific phosphodiesterase class I)